MSKRLSLIPKAIRIVFHSTQYRLLAVGSFVLFGALYAFVLPATYTGGRVGFVSLKLLNGKLALFAFLFSFFLALIIPFAVYAFRKRQKGQKTSSAAGGFFASVLPPILCCSPILPTIGAFVAGIFPFTLGASGFVQGFIATYETQIFTTIVVILAYSLYQNSKQVIYSVQGVCEL